jgi:hypothetical protein
MAWSAQAGNTLLWNWACLFSPTIRTPLEIDRRSNQRRWVRQASSWSRRHKQNQRLRHQQLWRHQQESSEIHSMTGCRISIECLNWTTFVAGKRCAARSAFVRGASCCSAGSFGWPMRCFWRTGSIPSTVWGSCCSLAYCSMFALNAPSSALRRRALRTNTSL